METALSVLFAVLTVVFVFYPIFRRHVRPEIVEDNTWDELLARRTNLYETIKDLEFDYLSGKIDRRDYEKLRQQFEMEAIDVIRRMDALMAADDEAEALDDDELEERIEREIEEYKHHRDVPAHVS